MDQNMCIPWLAAIKRLLRVFSMAPSLKKRRMLGTSAWQQSSTVASGMDTIRDKPSASGIRTMVRVLQRRRCSWAKLLNISLSLVWQKLPLRLRSLVLAISFLLQVMQLVHYGSLPTKFAMTSSL